MPKENIERAIKRGTGDAKDGATIEEVVYEGYAPHGVAVLISVVTDNRNRTVAEMRHVLSRSGGSMAEAGSVSWQFKRVAFFGFELGKNDPDKIFELAVEAGADDVTFEDDWVEIIGPVESFKEISDALKAARITPEEAELRFVPNNETELSDERHDPGLQGDRRPGRAGRRAERLLHAGDFRQRHGPARSGLVGWWSSASTPARRPRAMAWCAKTRMAAWPWSSMASSRRLPRCPCPSACWSCTSNYARSCFSIAPRAARWRSCFSSAM